MNIEQINESLEKRFYANIKVNLLDIHGCIEWQKYLRNGYGQISDKQMLSAHVVSYTLHYGKSPNGRYMQIDHTCRNRACVNPHHLEIVSQSQNILRGNSFAAKNARKTHCKNGHEFTPENTYIRKYGVSTGGRCCKECWKIRNRK
jgi:HNH endonuclease